MRKIIYTIGSYTSIVLLMGWMTTNPAKAVSGENDTQPDAIATVNNTATPSIDAWNTVNALANQNTLMSPGQELEQQYTLTYTSTFKPPESAPKRRVPEPSALVGLGLFVISCLFATKGELLRSTRK
ncbi:MAG: hypothetical protein SAL70_36425 [Scytonema sp. PMC 1070.18]|nr:hypothetical protein [Scytonema sp. PMC 1070.18]